jgi:hypothetical protein
MYSIDMNKHLWVTPDWFEIFSQAVSAFMNAVSRNPMDHLELLYIANVLDDLMQEYENLNGSIKDPLFYWYFATANAFFLQVGKKFDELGSSRVNYIVNGYKEALNKHLRYPSFTAVMLNVACENMEMFADDHDKEWLLGNKGNFEPISD